MSDRPDGKTCPFDAPCPEHDFVGTLEGEVERLKAQLDRERLSYEIGIGHATSRIDRLTSQNLGLHERISSLERLYDKAQEMLADKTIQVQEARKIVGLWMRSTWMMADQRESLRERTWAWLEATK